MFSIQLQTSAPNFSNSHVSHVSATETESPKQSQFPPLIAKKVAIYVEFMHPTNSFHSCHMIIVSKIPYIYIANKNNEHSNKVKKGVTVPNWILWFRMPSGQFSFYLHYRIYMHSKPYSLHNKCLLALLDGRNHKTCGRHCCANCICDMCSVRYAPHTINLHFEQLTRPTCEWEGARPNEEETIKK